MTTQVCNVRVQYIRPEYQNLKEWMEDTRNVYIGRRRIIFIDGKRFPEESSLWANPFKGGDTGEKYEAYIRDLLVKHPALIEELLKLEGKRLGCWCHPKSCHGNILVKLIEEYKQERSDG